MEVGVVGGSVDHWLMLLIVYQVLLLMTLLRDYVAVVVRASYMCRAPTHNTNVLLTSPPTANDPSEGGASATGLLAYRYEPMYPTISDRARISAHPTP